MTIRLMLFVKAPVAGAVKTRLTPPLTPGQAAQLHAAMAGRALAEAVSAGLGVVEIWRAGPDDHPFWGQLAAAGPVRLCRQVGGDLGARMHHAMVDAHERGLSAVIIGGDCPALDAGYLHAAVRALDGGADIVLGPAADGGYVLIGVHRPDASLFDGIDWGGAQVLAQTLVAVERLGWRCELLPALADIDRPEDLALLPEALQRVYKGYPNH